MVIVMRSQYPDIELLRKQLRNLDRSQFTFCKEAELGGGQDTPFEQAFANLAHAYLKDKAPTLQDYEVGFQLIDRNQENTKAVGVFGFKVGSQWLYAPVFFLNGDLKGHELLYIKNQDLFVPLKENWLNYLLNRRPHILGEGVSRDLSQKGVVAPNLYQLSRSPAKYASVKVAEWAKPVMADFAYFATTDPFQDKKYASMHTFLDFIKDAGNTGIELLVKVVNDYPSLRVTLNDMYGEDKLNETVKQAALNTRIRKSVLAKRLPQVAPSPSTTKVIDQEESNTEPGDKIAKEKAKSDIKVITYDRVMEVPSIGASLEDNEREALQAGDIVIKDKRDDKDVSIAYSINVPTMLQSPDSSGLYEVLTKPGEFKKCLIVFGPYDTKGRKTFCTVIDVKDKSWINVHPSRVWTKTKYERDVYDKWFESLSDSKSLSKGSGLKMLLGANGSGTLPFRVYRTNSGDTDSCEVFFQSSANKERSINWPNHKNQDPVLGLPSYGMSTIVRTNKVGKVLKSMGSELLAPESFKTFSLDSEECGCGFDSEPPAMLDLGSASAFELDLIKNGELKPITIKHQGSYVTVNQNTPMLHNKALIYLVKDAGLREKQARELLEMAKEDRSVSCLIKLAAPYDLLDQGPSAPAHPEPTTGADPMTGGQVPTTPGMQADMPVPGMGARDYDRNVYDVRPQNYSQPNTVDSSSTPAPDQAALQSAMQSAQSGQKEIFDTSMLGSLLKAVRSDSMIDRYMGDLMKGMDRLGRIMFMFYWHQDEFEERYGKQNIPEFDDGLRNAFEAMGDITLYLKKKKVEPHPDEMADIDLKSVAN